MACRNPVTWQLTVVDHLLFADVVGTEKLLQGKVAAVFLVVKHAGDRTCVPGLPVDRSEPFGIQRIRDLREAIPGKVHIEDPAYGLSLLGYDRDLSIHQAVSEHGAGACLSFLELIPNPPLAVFTYVQALGLGKRGKESQQHLAIRAHGVDVLLLEVNVHAI